jgi:hypothetical protein
MIALEQKGHEFVIVSPEALGAFQGIFVARLVIQLSQVVFNIKDMAAIVTETERNRCGRFPQCRVSI